MWNDPSYGAFLVLCCWMAHDPVYVQDAGEMLLSFCGLLSLLAAAFFSLLAPAGGLVLLATVWLL